MGARLSIERIGVHLGAVVHGVELRGPLSSVQREDLKNALDENQVLFFRDQNLTPEEILCFGTDLGALRVSQPGRFLGATDPFLMHERTAESPPRTERWHTDVPFVEDPPMVGLLAAVETPSVGGETAWASTYSMYDALSKPVQEFCRALKGEHNTRETVAYVRQHYGDEAADRVAVAFPTRLHPIVQVHPRTGKSHLFLGAAMSSIADLTPLESEMVLGYLRGGLNEMNIQIRWRWSPGDVAIWDERSTMHRALSDNIGAGERRALRSVFIDVLN